MTFWPYRALSARSRRTRTSKTARAPSTRRSKIDPLVCEGLEARLLLTADLSITKAQIAPISGTAPSAVFQGELIAYQITVADTGSTAATNTLLSDSLPMGETPISATSSTGAAVSLNGSAVTGNLGTIDAGSSVTVTVDALVNGQVTGTLTNTASVSSPDANSGLPVVSAPVSTTINALPNSAANLSITKTAANNDGAVSAGAAETYTLTVTNRSANVAQNVTVSDVLPPGVTFQSGAVTGGTGQTVLSPPANGVDSIDLGTLAANGSATITMALTAPNRAGLMVNTATVTTSSGNSSIANATASVATAVQGTTTSGNVDLSIAKTAAPTGSVGASQTESITVTNQGTSTATGVVVSDVLPAGEQFISGTTSVNGVNVTATGGVATATLPSLAAGQSETVTLTLTPTVAGAMTDTAYVESSQADANQTNNVATATTLITGLTGPAVDLSVTKTASSATGQIGSNETYTITIANKSANEATGVVLSDVLPGNATFVAANDGSGAPLFPVGNVLTDRIGTLAANGSQTFTVTLAPTAVGAITDTAYVTSDQLDTNLANNVATLTTPVQGTAAGNVDLSITKTAANNNASVSLGGSETYTITVTNNGSSPATGVVVSDVLPAAAAFVSGATNVSGVAVTDVNGVAGANLGTLAPGHSAILTVTLKPTAVGSLTDTAYVEGNEVDVNQANNLATVTTQVVSAATEANLSIAKIAAPSPGMVGQDLVYTLVVTNTGGSTADNVNVSDTLPSGVTLVSDNSSLSGAVLSNNNGTITANLGSVAAGGVDVISIIVTPNQAGTLSNTATVTTTSPNASTHTSSTVQTTINSSGNNKANLSITKVASPSPDTVGQNLTYTITVTNSADSAAADNVVVTDALPASGITFVSGSTDASGGTVANNNGTVTANLGTVAAGATDTITIVVTPTQAGTLTNTATVATTTQNSSSNTSSTVQTTINPVTTNEANLSITKTASPSPDTVGQNLTYTITVANAAGGLAADNVVVTDALPSSGISFVSGSTNVSGVAVTNNNGTVTANLGTVAAGATDTITIVVTPTQTGTLTNTAAVATTTQNASSDTSSTVQTTINPVNTNEADLSITKTASPSPDTVGQNLTYTITVTNAAGAAAVDNVVVSDTLPTSGITFVSGSTTVSGVTVTNNNGTVTANLGTVAAGATDTITLVVTPTQTGTVVNTASVTTTTPNASSNTSAVVNTAINQAVPPGHSCYLSGQPGDNSDQTFLTNLYRELLNRNPDATGFQYWLNFLATNGGTTSSGQSNAATRQFVSTTFLHSQEYEANFVDCVFDEFLKRHSDEGGQKFFVNQLSNGASEQTVIVEVISSQEYFAHNGHGPGNEGNSNKAFVDNLYLDLLGRAADTTGEQAWVNALNSGQITRQQLAQDFLQSPEAAKDILDAVGATAGAPGTPATGSYPLAAITGGGWDNLYFQGHLAALNGSAVDQFMGELENGTSWQTVQEQMVALPQYYNAS